MRAIRQALVVCGFVLLAFFAPAHRTGSQTNAAQSSAPYSLSVSVDEVVLTFHAADPHGLPVNDLKIEELRLLDDGRPPRRIVAFQLLADAPIRAGILMDESESMERDLHGNRAISIIYAQRLLRRGADQAFVMDFAERSQIAQPWTGDAVALTEGIRGYANVGRRNHGTAMFDAIYRACLNQFGHVDHAGSGNFILLFSDGEDNASHASLKNAVNVCQRTNTAIYAFRTDSKYSFGSAGPETLAELTAETGGSVFHDTGSEVDVLSDLRAIEANLRSQYRLVYRPAETKHDGAFHRIEVQTPERVDTIKIRSGYYAPVR